MIVYGLIAALACGILGQLGGLLKHQGANNAIEVNIFKPIQTIKSLFFQPIFATGISCSVLAFIAHCFALAWAPMSWVQAILASSMIFLAIMASIWFKASLGTKQWVGVSMVGIGMAFFALTVPGSPEHVTIQLEYLIGIQLLIITVGLWAINSHSKGKWSGGLLLAAASGLFVALGNIGIKSFFAAPDKIIALPWLFMAIMAAVIGFFAVNRAFQIAPAVNVLTATTLSTNIVTVLSGWIAFQEPIPKDAIGAIIHFTGFILIMAAIFCLPTNQKVQVRT